MNAKLAETYVVLVVMVFALIMALRAHAQAKRGRLAKGKEEEKALSPEEEKEEKEVHDAIRFATENTLPFWETYVLKKRAEPIIKRNRQRIAEIENEINVALRRDTPAMLWTILFCACIFYSMFRGLI